MFRICIPFRLSHARARIHYPTRRTDDSGETKMLLPVKWFSIPQCWRFENTQRGRKREHYQWNMDIVGVASITAEVELLAAIVTFFKRVGLTSADVGIKVYGLTCDLETNIEACVYMRHFIIQAFACVRDFAIHACMRVILRCILDVYRHVYLSLCAHVILRCILNVHTCMCTTRVIWRCILKVVYTHVRDPDDFVSRNSCLNIYIYIYIYIYNMTWPRFVEMTMF
jgi:hypothetical protein